MESIWQIVQEGYELIDQPKVQILFVEGGFAQNEVFLKTLSYNYYQKKVFASNLPQVTAIGAFLHLHGYKHLPLTNLKNILSYIAFLHNQLKLIYFMQVFNCTTSLNMLSTTQQEPYQIR